jgi:hypothetical protein
MKRFTTTITLASLSLLLAIACVPTATPLPTAISISVPTSKVTSTNTPTPTNTPVPPTPTSTSKPTKTPRPTRTPTPTATPTITSTPLPEMFRPVIPADEVFGGIEWLRSSPDGGLWAITDEGIARWVDDSWILYLADYTGKLAGIDGSGRIWVLGEDGSEISAWDGAPSGDGGSWTTYGADEGWTPLAESWYYYASGGQSDALGRLWFVTSQDVRVFDGERWIVITPADMGMGPPVDEELDVVFSVAIMESGAVWVAECEWGGPGPFGGRGVRWFDGSTWHGADSPVASGCATVITEDDAGHVWMGVEENLWRYDPASGAWTEFAPPEPPIDGRFGFLDHLTVDPSGDPWPMIVICGGASCYGSIALYRVHDGAWTQVGGVAEYDGVQWGPIFEADGTPWVFWDGGNVYRIVEDTPELMASLYTRSVVTDGSGQVWFLAWHNGQNWLWTLDTGTRR